MPTLLLKTYRPPSRSKTLLPTETTSMVKTFLLPSTNSYISNTNCVREKMRVALLKERHKSV